MTDVSWKEWGILLEKRYREIGEAVIGARDCAEYYSEAESKIGMIRYQVDQFNALLPEFDAMLAKRKADVVAREKKD